MKFNMNMTQLDYNLLTDSRIYIGAKKPYGGNFMESFDYISGGFIRRAMARLLLEQCPKDVSLGISRGSLFAYLVEEITDDLIEALKRAEEISIGERREEGFGRFIVCHPFHLEVTPV